MWAALFNSKIHSKNQLEKLTSGRGREHALFIP